jgi:HEAT repeat protein
MPCRCANKNLDVRRNAAEALGKTGDPRAVEPLSAALRDKDIALNAGWALVQIGPPAVEPLIAALRDEDLRIRAAIDLGTIGDARAMEPLIGALKDGDWRVRRAAAEALGKMRCARQAFTRC